MRIRLTAIIPSPRVEWRETENALRSRSLCDGRGISERGISLRSSENGARRRLQALGRAFAVSHSWNGRSDGLGKIVAERLGLVWRRLGFAHCRGRRVRPIVGALSIGRARKTYRLENRAGVFPDHVRDDGAFRRLRRIFRGANHERIAATASSAL